MLPLAVKKKSLVLDIDQCMLHSFIDEPSDRILAEGLSVSNLRNRRRMIVANVPPRTSSDERDFCAIKRPYLDDFLRFAAGYFDNIIVWSAGCREYVHELVVHLFKDHRKPDLVLTHDDVVYRDTDVGYHKPLRVVEDASPGLIDLSWTLFLDDSVGNFEENPENGLHIPVFAPDASKPFHSDDKCLLHLMEWLTRVDVKTCDDVRDLDKSVIFDGCMRGCIRCPKALSNVPTSQHRMLFSPVTWT